MYFAAGFVLLFLACLVLAFRKHPIYALYFYLATTYVHPPSRWWNIYLPELRWSLLAGLIALLALIVGNKKLVAKDRPWITTTPGLVMTLFVAWGWLQLPWSLDFETHLDSIILFTKYMLSFYLIYKLADTPQRIADTLVVHVLGCAFLGWLCYTVGRDEFGRLDGVGGPGLDDSGTLAMLLATGFLTAVVLVLTQTGVRRILCVLSMPLILNGELLANTRGAVAGMVAGALVVFVLRPPRRLWVFALGALFCVALGVRLVDDVFIERMFTVREATKDDGNIDGSAESRLATIDAQLQMAPNCLHGCGHRSTATLSPQYMEDKWLTKGGRNADVAERASHNTFLTLLVERGIPGVIFFVWALGWSVLVFLRLYRARGRLQSLELVDLCVACMAGLMVVLVSGIFQDFLMAEIQIWLVALMASALEQMDATAAPAGARSRAQTQPA